MSHADATAALERTSSSALTLRPLQAPTIAASGPMPDLDATAVSSADVSSAGGMGGAATPPVLRFHTIAMSAIPEQQIEWLVPELLPAGLLTVLIGEEGVGKGLFSCRLMANLTTAEPSTPVLLIAGEDDPATMLVPRLKAAGADLDRVGLLCRNPEDQSSIPTLPSEMAALRSAIAASGAGLLIIDPWLSVVQPKLQVKDTQQARQVLDPLAALARETGVTVLLVGHTNRGESASTRNRVGSTVALRQVARHVLYAAADPMSPEGLIVGVEKSNIGEIYPARRYQKSEEDGAYLLDPLFERLGETVQQFVARQTAESGGGDRRQTPLWDQVSRQLSETDVITRAEVVELYQSAGQSAAAADKALARWSKGDRPKLYAMGSGVYLSAASNRPPAPPVTGMVGGPS